MGSDSWVQPIQLGTRQRRTRPGDPTLSVTRTGGMKRAHSEKSGQALLLIYLLAGRWDGMGWGWGCERRGQKKKEPTNGWEFPRTLRQDRSRGIDSDWPYQALRPFFIAEDRCTTP